MIGTTLAHYEILELLGRGGMGEVYRARDTKLGRDVALKFLPEGFAHDPERLARFRREAKVLASLQHPNIAGIFGLEETAGRRFLVMELAEGQTLAERIAQGPIPQDETLEIARQVAAGLEEAHEKGVIHRDLKPANIKVNADGRVKILDFGLARALAGETAAEEVLSNSPTITAAMTGDGAILGTAAYMSPEQARGKTVDRRADIWAFGVVLYEMLAGKQLFEGETISDTLAAVLRAEYDWSALPEGVHPGVVRLLERCLERDPRRRLRDVGEARVFLESGLEDSSILAPASAAESDAGAATGGRIPVWMLVTAGTILFAGGLVLGGKVLAPTPHSHVLNTVLPPPAQGVFDLNPNQPGPPVLSPDGTMVAYVVHDTAGVDRIHLRRLDSPKAVVLSGTETATYPFWSPDSRFLGFGADGKLKKIAVTGGPSVFLCPAPDMKGGTWNRDGVILFAPDAGTGIHRVSAAGGEPAAVTTLRENGQEDSHRHPRFLPDGRRFLFIARLADGSGKNRVYLGSLDGGKPRRITISQVAAEFSADHILTVREGILLATPFDAKRGVLGKGEVPLVEALHVLKGTACGVYSTTTDGMLVYQTGMPGPESGLEFMDRTGRHLGWAGKPADFSHPRISPSGTQAAVEIFDRETDSTDIWLVDLASGLRTRFTFDPGNETNPCWTPDGREVVYTAQADSLYRIVRRPVEGTARGVIVLETDRSLRTDEVSPNGSRILFTMDSAGGNFDQWMIPTSGGEPQILVQGARTQGGGRISPDGRWLAYIGETSTWFEIYVRALSGGTRKWQISQGGAVYPFWGPNGEELFYTTVDAQVTAVPVRATATTFRVGAPKSLFMVPLFAFGGSQIAPHPDGERFLVVSKRNPGKETQYLHLVTDWQRGLAP